MIPTLVTPSMETAAQRRTRERVLRAFPTHELTPHTNPEGTYLRWWEVRVGSRTARFVFGEGEAWIDDGYDVEFRKTRRYSVGKRTAGRRAAEAIWHEFIDCPAGVALRRISMTAGAVRARAEQIAAAEREATERMERSQFAFNALLSRLGFVTGKGSAVVLRAKGDGTATLCLRRPLDLGEMERALSALAGANVLGPRQP
jgi:hypothetical protein